MTDNDWLKQVRRRQRLRSISALAAHGPGKVGQTRIAFPDKVGREWWFAPPVTIPGGNRAGNDIRLLLGLAVALRMFLMILMFLGLVLLIVLRHLSGCLRRLRYLGC